MPSALGLVSNGYVFKHEPFWFLVEIVHPRHNPHLSKAVWILFDNGLISWLWVLYFVYFVILVYIKFAQCEERLFCILEWFLVPRSCLLIVNLPITFWQLSRAHRGVTFCILCILYTLWLRSPRSNCWLLNLCRWAAGRPSITFWQLSTQRERPPGASPSQYDNNLTPAPPLFA